MHALIAKIGDWSTLWLLLNTGQLTIGLDGCQFIKSWVYYNRSQRPAETRVIHGKRLSIRQVKYLYRMDFDRTLQHLQSPNYNHEHLRQLRNNDLEQLLEAFAHLLQSMAATSWTAPKSRKGIRKALKIAGSCNRYQRASS